MGQTKCGPPSRPAEDAGGPGGEGRVTGRGRRLTGALGACWLTGCAATAVAAEGVTQEGGRFAIALETGAVWFSRNDVRIPGDTGTEFDMLDLTGDGPEPYFRLSGEWDITPRHGLRLEIAPLEVSGTGNLPGPTRFAGQDFAAGGTEGTYEFSVYKATYRYTFHDRDAWRWRVGFTGLVRDANVELRQGAVVANDDDLGFVPLLHLAGEYALHPRWRLGLDFDGLAGGPGRAFDVALRATYDLTSHWRVGGGYRTLEGGVDTDDVYNFAWLHYGFVTAGYRF